MLINSKRTGLHSIQQVDITQSTTLSAKEKEALAFLIPLSQDYPGIENWFIRKVVPGLRDGTRLLLRIERENVLVGIGIGKYDHTERKICTVRISPQYAGRGLGLRIFDNLLRWLDTDQPHLTVTDHRLPIFERIFNYYGFNLTSHQKGLYVPNASELSYNETASNPDLSDTGENFFYERRKIKTLSHTGLFKRQT
ncbi:MULTISPECIES: GNAT family N-acetyltransferase [Acetobacteraceae]|uniref:GNAT family N-acetyltransferase n=1 Tax=Acetobacteraceae TaxID=433 RepID=UPI001138189E|nr:GNAT family N-acetyltransferase [Acetobacter sp. DmW_136]GCE90266.1 hypothetical protein MSKU15_1867 [Komagataeibacter diospyri]